MVPPNESKHYDQNFYLQQRDQSRESAAEVVPYLMARLAPKRVVDVGCGVGTWLAEFGRHGVAEVVGMDGSYVKRDMLQIPADRFRPSDLAAPESIKVTESFDLAMSLEVAEHLPADAADGFVALLTSLAPTVVFSAAIPGQGGVNHINEQWADYWLARFAKHGYLPADCLRPHFWENPQVQLCYRQNMFLLTRDEALRQRLLEERKGAAWPLRMVHAETMTEIIARPPTLRVLLQSLPGALAASIQARLRR